MQMNSKGQKEQEQSKVYSILVFRFLKTNLQMQNRKGKKKNESK
jgi:hypothetical protein